MKSATRTSGPAVLARRPRLERPDVLRAADERAEGREVALEQAMGAGLDQDVAECGRLNRSGEDRQLAGIGGQLAQELVARPATDEMHDPHLQTGEPLGIVDRPGKR